MRYADCHGESAGRSGDIGHKRRGGICRYAVPDIFPCAAYTYHGIPAIFAIAGGLCTTGLLYLFAKRNGKLLPIYFLVGRHRSCVPISFFYADHGREHGQQQLSARGKMAGRKYLGNELASGSCPVAIYAHTGSFSSYKLNILDILLLGENTAISLGIAVERELRLLLIASVLLPLPALPSAEGSVLWDW